MTKTLTIIRPDDWHLHLRDGAVLSGTVPATAQVFHRAIIMPNLTPPIMTDSDPEAYRTPILAATPDRVGFEPLMVWYLTDDTTPQHIAEAAASGIIFGAKLYPAGATTTSSRAVPDP